MACRAQAWAMARRAQAWAVARWALVWATACCALRAQSVELPLRSPLHKFLGDKTNDGNKNNMCVISQVGEL